MTFWTDLLHLLGTISSYWPVPSLSIILTSGLLFFGQVAAAAACFYLFGKYVHLPHGLMEEVLYIVCDLLLCWCHPPAVRMQGLLGWDLLITQVFLVWYNNPCLHFNAGKGIFWGDYLCIWLFVLLVLLMLNYMCSLPLALCSYKSSYFCYKSPQPLGSPRFQADSLAEISYDAFAELYMWLLFCLNDPGNTIYW